MTIISIAYRLTTLKNCDKIIVMDKGQIVQTGKFKKLMKICLLYTSRAVLIGNMDPGKNERIKQKYVICFLFSAISSIR